MGLKLCLIVVGVGLLHSTESAQRIFESFHHVRFEPESNGIRDGVDSARADDTRHPCNRECRENDRRTCRYVFNVEYYQTMSRACYDCPRNITHCEYRDCIAGDGVKRTLSVVNRRMPGPAIEVCHGDAVEVEVRNDMHEVTTSIHWHGQHQRGSQFMDGVPYVTQCPISPKASFVYRFNATNAGTHFWHSHSGLQRGDGLYGSLVVRLPRSRDQFSDLFDYDLSQHVVSIADWTHVSSVPKYVAHHHSNGDNKPVNILVNGKGRFNGTRTPIERFRVAAGFRYRFRLINAGFLNCPIELSVDNHTLVIVSTDGADLEPVEAESLVSYAGERFDFIIQMNQPVDNYWIRFRGLMDCDERFNSVFQVAVLHYEGADEDAEPSGDVSYGVKPSGIQVNSLNTGLRGEGSVIAAEMRTPLTSSRKDPCLKAVADHQFFVAYDFYPKDNVHYHVPEYYGFYGSREGERTYTPQLNHITMALPAFPLLGNREDESKLNFCNSSTIPKECEAEYCECTHVLRVRKDSVVEIVLVDEGFTYDANHPFHLHGYSFRVIGMDRLGPNVTERRIRDLDKRGLLMKNLKDAPIKDTVTVPDGGYTVLRWHATNPGFWLFHCHIDFHSEIGMALVFKVGDDSDHPREPSNFPRCNNFYHKLRDDATDETVTYNNNNNNNYDSHDSNEIVFFKELGENYLRISSHDVTSDAFATSSIRAIVIASAVNVILRL